MLIQVCGTGCAKCKELEKLVREVVGEVNSPASVEHVTDIQKIAQMGVFSTPALVVDGEVKFAGGIPAKKDIAAWIA